MKIITALVLIALMSAGAFAQEKIDISPAAQKQVKGYNDIKQAREEYLK